ncbi:11376_t:CDS:2 [Diversispora eburnea]|uniref:11376_t:CDS:1 n=1 Tax=Diversispora eburnea TaxID=1213867 RepID=A0A9N8UZ72_9GLOM|nr:11376_t:CDS:2 [Diversispora eburnea]
MEHTHEKHTDQQQQKNNSIRSTSFTNTEDVIASQNVNEPSYPTKQEQSSTGEGIPNKTVRAGTDQGTAGVSTPSGFFPGNDGDGGDYYKSLQDKRTRELPKSSEYKKQFSKDTIGEKRTSQRTRLSVSPNGGRIYLGVTPITSFDHISIHDIAESNHSLEFLFISGLKYINESIQDIAHLSSNIRYLDLVFCRNITNSVIRKNSAIMSEFGIS